MRPQKPEGKMVEQSYVWTMMNLCPSLSCLSQKATGIKNHSWWPIGLLALMTGRCVALWSSCTNRSLWNRAGPRPVRPRHTDQSPHGATMAVACHACPVGRQMEQGSSDACNLWAQQFCLVTEWLCIEGFFFWKYVITEWGQSVLSPEIMWKFIICAPVEYKGQGSYFFHNIDVCRLTFEKKGHRGFLWPLFPSSAIGKLTA